MAGTDKPTRAAVRKRYQKGGVTMRELATQTGWSLSTIRDWATADGWVVSRETVQHRTNTKTQQILIDYMAIQAADVINLERESYLQVTNKGRELLASADKAKDAKAAADTVRIGIEGLRHSLAMDLKKDAKSEQAEAFEQAMTELDARKGQAGDRQDPVRDDSDGNGDAGADAAQAGTVSDGP